MEKYQDPDSCHVNDNFLYMSTIGAEQIDMIHDMIFRQQRHGILG